jgi:hypothetical protein
MIDIGTRLMITILIVSFLAVLAISIWRSGPRR